MSSFPKPDVRYRIQSDDFDTYLELYDVENSVVVPRLARRETLLQQVCALFVNKLNLRRQCRILLLTQWIFVPPESPLKIGTYDILNVATQSLPLRRYLSFAPPGRNYTPAQLLRCPSSLGKFEKSKGVLSGNIYLPSDSISFTNSPRLPACLFRFVTPMIRPITKFFSLRPSAGLERSV